MKVIRSSNVKVEGLAKEEKTSLIKTVTNYLANDLSVIPVPYKSKKAIIPWKKYQKEKASQKTIKRWFGNKGADYQTNVAIICGSVSNNLFVIDFDLPGLFERVFSRHEELLKETFVVKRGDHFHVYFRTRVGVVPNLKYTYLCKDNSCNLCHPPNSSKPVGHEALSVRSKGMMIIAPPSIHPTGDSYEIVSSTTDVGWFDEPNEFLDVFTNQLTTAAPDIKLVGNYDKKKLREMRKTLPIQMDNTLKGIMASELIRECIKEEIRTLGRSKNFHANRSIDLAISSELIANGFTKEAFRAVFSQCSKFKEKETSDQYKHLQQTRGGELRYRPHMCVTLQKYGICVEEKCPIYNKREGIEGSIGSEEGEEEGGLLAEINEEREFVNILPKDHVISQYLDFTEGIGYTYPEFNFSVILTLLSLATNRNIFLKTIFITYPNIFSLWLAISTLGGKGNAFRFMKMVYTDVNKYYPNDFSSPSSLIEIMQDNPRGFFCMDEYGQILAKTKREYMAGIDDLFCHIYDCPDNYIKRLRSKGGRKQVLTINDTFPVSLAACPPSVLSTYVTEQDILSGRYARDLIIFPTRNREFKPERELTEEEKEKVYNLRLLLKDYFNAFNYQTTPFEFTFQPDALKRFNSWMNTSLRKVQDHEDKELLAPVVGRSFEHVKKIAMLLVLGDGRMRKILAELKKVTLRDSSIKLSKEEREEKEEKIKREKKRLFVRRSTVKDITNDIYEGGNFFISLYYLNKAIYYVENLFLPSAVRMLSKLNYYQNYDKVNKVYDIILKEQGITHSVLMRKTRLMKKEFAEIVETLVESNKIKVESYRVDNKRASRYYFALAIKKDQKEKEEN